jgi:D-serine deaminase-like pyridoxal phosphate-dependent protein
LAAALKAEGTEADVFVEIDVGQGRCGLAPAAAGALALAFRQRLCGFLASGDTLALALLFIFLVPIAQ